MRSRLASSRLLNLMTYLLVFALGFIAGALCFKNNASVAGQIIDKIKSLFQK
ncbi:hypothetical protein UFOVP510_46 [uncultured Caudovirales phage]|uniref:Uncharacterized protein n=1 Tax=uncultured Caudovirales phage TaxID=2100421 RepID=A0A6J5MPV5_9CAUD|nr:hypothetical protein UFOVP510_46 [uncultured Caudovirales phage]